MNDKEFQEMIDKLWDIGLNDGDLGYKYWSKIVFELKEMRKSQNFIESLRKKAEYR